MQKHYVTFISPGTFVSESTTKEVDSWDVKTAFEMSKTISERYNATPYAFSFFTKENRVFYKDLPHIEYIGCGLCICYDLEQDENGEEIIKNMARCPRCNCALFQRQVRVRDDEFGVDFHLGAQARAVGAGAER